jgi:REP element-mobilizing transposase RayT
MGNNHLPRDHYNRDAYLSHFRGRSTRLPDHDYSAPHVYHIVTCAKGIHGREPLFTHPTLRALLQTNLVDLPLRYPGIYIEVPTVMPDHIHFLIWMNKYPDRLQGGDAPQLWEVMRSYKSKVAVEWIDYVKKNHPDWSAKIWQQSYYDRLMRTGDLEKARRYISENPDQSNKLVGWEAFYEYMGWIKPGKSPSNPQNPP